MKLAMDLKLCPWCGGPTYERETQGSRLKLIFECTNVDCPVQPSMMMRDREHGKALWNERHGE